MRRHWPQYAMETIGRGLFMLAATALASLLQHPASPARQAIEGDMAPR